MSHISEVDTQIANKYIERYSTSLIIREMQIKTTMRYHHIPVRIWLLSESPKIKNVCEDMEKREFWCTVGGNVN